MTNHLHYGDNLIVLRNSIASESVDLIYLDPPFNSNADYNALFKTPKGASSPAQMEAFTDTWTWDDATSGLAVDEVKRSQYQDAAKMLDAMVGFLGKNALTAYLAMMAVRLIELHRVLKPTGSLYLHCDPTASHYLKILLDAVFGKDGFRNEISWRRSSAHSDTKQGMDRLGKIRDIILFYTKGKKWFWKPQYTPYDPAYFESEYRHREASGRLYKETDATAAKSGGDVSFLWRVKRRRDAPDRWEADLEEEFQTPVEGWEYLGVPPYNGRFWAYSKANLAAFWREGKLVHRETGMPRIRHYADEMPGVPLQDDWSDILPATGKERLGYPTQKPVALLERILNASSNPGDVVLDPFCGCGTTVHAAEKLGRAWIGIDVTHLAIGLIEKRLRDAFPGVQFQTHGVPQQAVAWVPTHHSTINSPQKPSGVDLTDGGLATTLLLNFPNAAAVQTDQRWVGTHPTPRIRLCSQCPSIPDRIGPIGCPGGSTNTANPPPVRRIRVSPGSTSNSANAW